MSHWLLPHDPARADVGDLLTAGQAGIDWPIRRYRDRITVGDHIGLWVTGDDGGLAALGTVTDAPRTGPDGDAIGIVFSRILPDPLITHAQLIGDPRSAPAALSQTSGGGDPFPVEPDAWAALTDRIPAVRPHDQHQFIAKTVLAAAAIAMAGATAIREAVRSVAK